MREAKFIEQNKSKWLTFENVLTNKNTELPADQLSDLYIEVTDHLSYAQTYYPNSDTLIFLNSLASKAHQQLYKTKKENSNRLYHFWAKEFPLEFYKYQNELLISFFIAVIFSLIGAYSSATDPSFVRAILGDAYVNLTLENIANKDPMAIYKDMEQMDMFLGITINNIRVALFCFSFGILFGIGTIFILMQNFIMLGSFQYFFYDKGLLWESARTIWIHGTIEISVIIIAGCAGLVVGKSIWFPKTYTRLDSFTRGVKAGLKIVISTIPFFIIAGFLEGFVTRHTEMPDMLAIFIIMTSLLLIVYYYIIYPNQLYKKYHGYKIH